MGKSRWTACHPKGLISFVVAGMLVFMGMQAAAAPALKPQRSERIQPLEFARKLSSQDETLCRSGDAPSQICNSVSNPVDVFQANIHPALVIAAKATQVGFVRDEPQAPLLRFIGIASPRGPPDTIL
jgi:hypothetical protein